LTIFSKSIYPRIPEQYGGGEPKRAELLFKSEARTQAADIGIPFNRRSYLSRPVNLLYAGDDYYTLQLDNGRVVQLAKDTILGSSTDSKRPTARKVQTRDVGGHVGVPESGDQLVLTYSEQVAPATVMPGWTGRSTPVDVRVAAPPDRANDGVTVWDLSHRRKLALGVIEFRFGQTSTVTVPRFTSVHISQTGAQVIVTLDEPLGLSRPRAGTFLVWIPSEDAADGFGNRALGRDVQETGDDNPHLRPEF
jgi:hypothetical protein